MMRTTLHHIDTSGLPRGFDCTDLIEQGITGDALYAWIKARLRPGAPPPEGEDLDKETLCLSALLTSDFVATLPRMADVDAAKGRPDTAVVTRTASDWAEPKPIYAALLPVPTFDPETLLPNVMRGWIMDEADRMPCPPDFIAAAAVVALSSIIGARCAIKPKARDPWLIVPNLWGRHRGLAIGEEIPRDRSCAKAT